MGLTTGHVFSDGDTVTAAKLNSMVNDATISSDTITSAMIQDDAIDSRHIADGAITSNHITTGAVSLGSVESGQTTEGYLVQTDSTGDLTTLNVGASGTVLVSGGAETAPSFTTLGASGVSSAMISDHDKLEAPYPVDLLFAKSVVYGVNKRLEIQDLYKTVNGLTALSASDIADADEFLVLDAGTPKKITKSSLDTAFGGGQIPSSGSNYYSATSTSDLTTIISSESGVVTFTHGLSGAPRLVRVVAVCISSDINTGYVTGDEVEGHNLYYFSTSFNFPAFTTTSDSSSIDIRFEDSITVSGGTNISKLAIQHKSLRNIIDMPDASGGKFKLKVYAWA